MMQHLPEAELCPDRTGAFGPCPDVSQEHGDVNIYKDLEKLWAKEDMFLRDAQEAKAEMDRKAKKGRDIRKVQGLIMSAVSQIEASKTDKGTDSQKAADRILEEGAKEAASLIKDGNTVPDRLLPTFPDGFSHMYAGPYVSRWCKVRQSRLLCIFLVLSLITAFVTAWSEIKTYLVGDGPLEHFPPHCNPDDTTTTPAPIATPSSISPSLTITTPSPNATEHHPILDTVCMCTAFFIKAGFDVFTIWLAGNPYTVYIGALTPWYGGTSAVLLTLASVMMVSLLHSSSRLDSTSGALTPWYGGTSAVLLTLASVMICLFLHAIFTAVVAVLTYKVQLNYSRVLKRLPKEDLPEVDDSEASDTSGAASRSQSASSLDADFSKSDTELVAKETLLTPASKEAKSILKSGSSGTTPPGSPNTNLLRTTD